MARSASRQQVLNYLRAAHGRPADGITQVQLLTLTEAVLYILVLTDWLLAELNDRFDQWVSDREAGL